MTRARPTPPAIVRVSHDIRARQTRNGLNLPRIRTKETAFRTDSRNSFCAIVTRSAHGALAPGTGLAAIGRGIPFDREYVAD